MERIASWLFERFPEGTFWVYLALINTSRGPVYVESYYKVEHTVCNYLWDHLVHDLPSLRRQYNKRTT